MLYANKSQIKKIISKDRLDGYFNEVQRRHGQCDLLEVYTYYSWNILLSESLYASLQALEVSLRNSIQNSGKQHFGNAFWFEDPTIMHSSNIKRVTAAKDSLIRQNKNVDASRIVAELHFGFWNSLFYARYEYKIWRPLFKRIFPMMDWTRYNRKFVSTRLERIRRLRNRAFHFEPIWYRNLTQIHSEIVELISWIEPAMVNLLNPVDHFLACCTQDKLDEIRNELRQIY